MADTPDLDSLRAVMAQRTPGELYVEEVQRTDDEPRWLVWAAPPDQDDEGVALAEFYEEDEAKAFVAAVNAIGPLLERVRDLERGNELPPGAKWAIMLPPKKIEPMPYPVDDDDADLDAKLAAANERIAGLERLFDEQAKQHKDATLVAVERIAGLEAEVAAYRKRMFESIEHRERKGR